MEGTRKKDIGYFGADLRVLPDAWNPVSQYARLYLIAGADTTCGWGIGPGLYGNGALQWLSVNLAYSSRPLAKSLGDRVDIWAVGVSAAVPF
jgi:hypothetical protein